MERGRARKFPGGLSSSGRHTLAGANGYSIQPRSPFFFPPLTRDKGFQRKQKKGPGNRFFSSSRHRWPFQSEEYKFLEESYVFSKSRLIFREDGEPTVSPPTSRNLSFRFSTQAKVYELFFSHYNHNFSITACGFRNYILWFDFETIRWIIDCLPRFSGGKSWAIYSYEKNRTIELFFGSSNRGNFLKIQEIREEGRRFILIPAGVKNDGITLLFKALSFFIDKATKDISESIPTKEPSPISDDKPPPSTAEQFHNDSSLLPHCSQVNSTVGEIVVVNTQVSNLQQEVQNHKDGEGFSEGQLIPSQGDSSVSSLVFPPLPKSTLSPLAPCFVQANEAPARFPISLADYPPLARKSLSPFASPFIPTTNNPINALLPQDLGCNSLTVLEEDPLSMDENGIQSLKETTFSTKEGDNAEKSPLSLQFLQQLYSTQGKTIPAFGPLTDMVNTMLGYTVIHPYEKRESAAPPHSIEWDDDLGLRLEDELVALGGEVEERNLRSRKGKGNSKKSSHKSLERSNPDRLSGSKGKKKKKKR